MGKKRRSLFCASSKPVEIPAGHCMLTRIQLGTVVLLVLAVIGVYARTLSFRFVNFDDYAYVVHNRHVQTGLTWPNLVWAFTTFEQGNWHPLTWLSHMLDTTLFGKWPGGHHATSFLLHATSAVLLLFALRMMTGDFWKGALVAAIFALHPLRVESVAWVAERKDVLATLFFTQTLLCYTAYIRRRHISNYLIVLSVYALGLLSKPMLVSTPVVLLLLDYWPLQRFGDNPRSILLEKLPLAGMASASCVVTFFAQRAGEAVGSLGKYPLEARVANAVLAYFTYLAKTVWPSGLAALYPYEIMSLSDWPVVAGMLLLVIATVVTLAVGRRLANYVVTGWLWYLVTLLPVIGLIQVGMQSSADRYTYIPQIGLIILAVWGLSNVALRITSLTVKVGVSLAIILALIVASVVQVGWWRDSVTLFSRVMAVTGRNGHAAYLLGSALDELGRHDEAEKWFWKAVSYSPDHVFAHNNLAISIARRGDYEGALEELRQALRINPANRTVLHNYDLYCRKLAVQHYNYAVELHRRGRLADARQNYEEALRWHPDFAEAHNNLGLILAGLGLNKEAARHFREALRVRPDLGDARKNLDALVRTARQRSR